jgi:hypothetical protein
VAGRGGSAPLGAGEGFRRGLDVERVLVGWTVGGPVRPSPTLRCGGGGCRVIFGLGVVGIGGDVGKFTPAAGGVLLPSEYEIVGECGCSGDDGAGAGARLGACTAGVEGAAGSTALSEGVGGGPGAAGPAMIVVAGMIGGEDKISRSFCEAFVVAHLSPGNSFSLKITSWDV